MGIDNFLEDLLEIQLTSGSKGHFLHPVQSFSPDDKWLVYDTRNDDTHIGRTCCIEMINIDSKDTVRLYSTKNQMEFGPGVGAVTFNPQKNQGLFIHGFSRRTGVSIKTELLQQPIFLDARDVTEPYTPGALRGGAHAHTWSPDGEWISFTYNDEVLTKSDSGKPIEGTAKTRPMPPTGTVQRRITFTGDRKYPGIQGPRHPVRSLTDGSSVLFMMKDDDEIVQIYGVSPNGGEIEQFTRNKSSIETTFDISADGKYLAYGIEEQIYITEISSGLTRKIKNVMNSRNHGLRAINWSNNGKTIAYNRQVIKRDTSYYQIFMLKLGENDG